SFLDVTPDTTKWRAYPAGKPWDRQPVSGKLRRKLGVSPGFRTCRRDHAEVSSPIEALSDETRVADCIVLQPGRRRWRGATARRRRIHGRRYQPRRRRRDEPRRRDRRQRFSRWRRLRRLSRRLRRLLRRLRRLSRRLLRWLRRLLFTLFL